MNYRGGIDMGVLWGLLFAAPLVGAADEANPNCGPNCLYIALRSLDMDIGPFDEFYERQFLKRFGRPDARGYSLGQMETIARELGLQTLGVKTSLERLRHRPPPVGCIAWIRQSHFVLIQSVSEETVEIIDPPRTYTMPAPAFKNIWDGTALLISSRSIPDEDSLSALGRQGWRWAGIIAGLACVVGVVGFVFWRRHHVS
jgi:ABC-type bacteriocin/lantibiotic exporter with double-glycine peptidase domain